MEFSEMLQEVIKKGILSTAVILAKEIGIFDVLASAESSLTSQEVADAKGLRERYVREILGALTSASLVRVSAGRDDSHPTYFLSQDAKESVSNGELYPLGLVKAVATAYPGVKKACYSDGPLGAPLNDDLFRFFEERVTLQGSKTVNLLLESTHGLLDRLERGISVLEVGSGTGRLLRMFAERFPNSTFTASDYRESLVANLKARLRDLPNVGCEVIDICQLPEGPARYDWVLSVNMLHDLPHPLVAMRNIRKLVKERSGVFTVSDLAGPGSHLATAGRSDATAIYVASSFLCIPESYQSPDSEAHGASWARTTAASLLEQAGFDVALNAWSDYRALFVCRCRKAD